MKPARLVVALTLGMIAASAQWAPAPVTLAYAEGNVFVDHRPVLPLQAPLNIRENSVVRSEKGRAEIHFARGDTLSWPRIARSAAPAGSTFGAARQS